ncbi:MAG TPA: alkaline phosphatase family protein [Candidatus Limnocylindrales bacterium]|nr:alkaline phosphatase family protein [Candidatus Limnocylindrales bacterium]
MLRFALRCAVVAAGALCVPLLSLDPSSAHAGTPTAGKLTVVVVVVDSLMPEELGQVSPATPALTAFRDAGTSFAESRAVFSGETIPNHVSMMTGVYPDRSGIPTNSYWNRTGTPEERDLSLPSELEASTLFTRIHSACPELRTAAALSKNYLYEVFSECGYSGTDCGGNDAPHVSFDPSQDPSYIEPSGHTPDPTTMREALEYLPGADFLFINLGDVDRSGHIDTSGPYGPPNARYAALADTDTQFAELIQALQDAGRWERTVMLVVSDHGMDWSTPFDFVNLSPDLPEGLFAIQAGGTGSIYLVDATDPLRDQKLADARALALAHEGVAAAWYREPNPLDPGADTVLPDHLAARHANFGDLIVMAADGWRISEPSSSSNPLPGNHGHKTTLHNTFIVGGGVPFVIAQTVGDPDGNADHFLRAAEQSENIDVAATVGWLLGLDVGDMDGRPLTESFTLAAPPSDCGVLIDTDGDGVADYEDPCPLQAGATDCVCPPAAGVDCASSAVAKISMRDGDRKSLKFTWGRGEASTTADFGDPTASDSLALCLYDETGRKLSVLRMPEGSDWSATGSGAWKYKDAEAAPDGVTSALLKPGDDGKAKVVVKAGGDDVTLPDLPPSLPLQAQVHSETGQCWEATFDSADVRRSEEDRFDAAK